MQLAPPVRAVLVSLAGILLCACGAKTGLLFEVSERDLDGPDAGTDAGQDAAAEPDADGGARSCEIAPFEPPVQADDPLSSIWIANSGEGTVSKLDTRTGVEVARYRTGESLATDPSRTSVDLSGAVYVGNRVFDSSTRCAVTKIAGRLGDCVDRDGNGVIDTSHGSVALDWGRDECVLWSTPVGEQGCLLRAVAVDVSEDDAGRLRTVVYAGCWTTHEIIQLDADTGAVLQELSTGNVSPYGFAVTAQGTMFVASGVTFDVEPHFVGVVDLLTTPPSLQETELPECPGTFLDGKVSYGIAADRRGRLWTCSMLGCLHRFDPATRVWTTASTGSCRGVAVGPDGTIWTGMDETLQRWDPDSMQVLQTVPTSGQGGIGVAIDFDGKVWFVNQMSQDASRIDPTTGTEEGRFPVGLGPYTYSDMTGLQLRTNLGVYWQFTHVFEQCDERTVWDAIALDVDLPLGSGVRARMRGADGPDDLPAASFVDADAIWDAEAAVTPVPAALGARRFLEIDLTAARGADGRWPTLHAVRARGR